jgi:serine/threonine protein kinase
MADPLRIAGRFEVIRPLGRGAFAHTLLAKDTSLSRMVALKVLHPKAAADWKAYELFEREASVLKELRHPGIPMIHEAFRAPYDGADAAFLAMEYIEGTSLAQIIADRRHLEQAEILHLFDELLGLLDYLHSRVPPVLHRDIKPANILVRPNGTPALVDFGAVRNAFRAADDGGSTVVGTYGYMPYEQYMGRASPASDLYALGATFLHLITGREPPEFMSSAGRLEVPPGLSTGEPLRGVLARLLQPAASDRFQSAREARAALMASPAGAALVPATATGAAVVFSPVPPPRPLTGEAKGLFRRAVYSTWELMNTDSDPGLRPGVLDLVFTVFFSVVTAGILPAVFVSRHFGRRRRVRPFVIHGLPAIARVLEVEIEKLEFGARLGRVRYAFEADGRRRVGSDRILPAIAERWEQGTEIQVLYLPDRDYDSVIIGSA